MGTSIDYPQNVASIQISNTGRMVPLTACPNCVAGAPPFTVSVEDGRNSLQRNITVSATGSLTVEDFAHALEGH